ncbi:MAG TPA: hypothetical protein VGB55_04935 [Tepidisphaeraceae bacterium]|jgi:hypothetical protein
MEDVDEVTAPFLVSDLAQEVRSLLLEHSPHGADIGPATAVVFETFGELLRDPNDGPVIFLAVAAWQLQNQQLLEPIRDAALALIDSGDAQRAYRQTDATIDLQKKTALTKLAAALREATVR